MMIGIKEPTECDDCREMVTPEHVEEDSNKIYKTREGAMLCESCYKNYEENAED